MRYFKYPEEYVKFNGAVSAKIVPHVSFPLDSASSIKFGINVNRVRQGLATTGIIMTVQAEVQRWHRNRRVPS